MDVGNNNRRAQSCSIHWNKLYSIILYHTWKDTKACKQQPVNTEESIYRFGGTKKYNSIFVREQRVVTRWRGVVQNQEKSAKNPNTT
jgi:hypothetical protein